MSQSQARDDGHRRAAATRRRVDGWDSESASLRLSYRAGHPPRLARWCTPRRAVTPIVAFRSRESTCLQLPANNRPSSRPPLSFSSRACQPSAPRAQPGENSRQLSRDRRLTLAEQPPRVIDQQQIAAPRETFHHSLARRIELPPIFDWAQPDRVFQAGRAIQARRDAALRGLQDANPSKHRRSFLGILRAPRGAVS